MKFFSREYRSKLAVAIKLASDGIPICFGHKSFVRSLYKSSKVPGVIYNKGAGDEVQKLDYQKDVDAGHLFVAQDEEAGIIYDDYMDFYTERTSLHDLSQISKFFTWGDADQKFFDSLQVNQNKVYFTGSPRASFWGELGHKVFENEISMIKARYGNYVFFPTNFATFNSFLSESEYENHLKKFSVYRDTLLAEMIERKQWKYESEMMKLVLESAVSIAEKLNKNVVIRPHPSENTKEWIRRIKNFPRNARERVHVIREGDVTPWILAAQVVIQRGCTTGLEAVLSGIPTLSYILSGWQKQDPKRGFVDQITPHVSNVDSILSILSDKHVNLYNKSFHANASHKVKDPGSEKNILSIANEIRSLYHDCNLDSDYCPKPIMFSSVKDFGRIYLPRPDRAAQSLDTNKRPILRKNSVKKHIAYTKSALKIEDDFDLKLIGPSTFLLKKS